MINMTDYKKRIFEVNSNDEFEKSCMIAFGWSDAVQSSLQAIFGSYFKKQTPKNIYQIPFLR